MSNMGGYLIDVSPADFPSAELYMHLWGLDGAIISFLINFDNSNTLGSGDNMRMFELMWFLICKAFKTQAYLAFA